MRSKEHRPIMALTKCLPNLALIGALILSACATVSPEARVRTKLIEAGVKPRVAGCMAERMVDRLSLEQLRKLQSLANLPRRANADDGGISIDEVAHRLRALDDPVIVSVVLRAGIGCSIAS
jgi:hypothetical protein